MRVYIASSFSLLDQVKAVAEVLEREGHSITVKWWDRKYDIPGERGVHTVELKKRYDELDPDEFYSKPETWFSYESDAQGVKDADALVFVADAEPRKFNGAAVELGMALGAEKPCYLLRCLENSVLYAPVIRCKDPQDLICKLQEDA